MSAATYWAQHTNKHGTEKNEWYYTNAYVYIVKSIAQMFT